MKNNARSCSAEELWKPLPHVPPGNFRDTFLFCLRLFLDLEVCTVYRDLKRTLPGASGRVLEVGCGLQPYRHLLPRQAEYHALDWENAHGHFGYRAEGVVYYDGTRFPFPDGTFGLVFHTEVLEHVYHLAPFLSECHRVLAQGGRMLFTVPFASRNHYIPHDYWRLTPASITRLLQEAHFADIGVVPRGGDIAVAVHKINSVLYRILFRDIDQRALRWARRAFFMFLFAVPVALFTLVGHGSILLKAGSPDDPLGYTVSCAKTAEPSKIP